MSKRAWYNCNKRKAKALLHQGYNDHQRERRNAARDCIKKMQKEQDALILRKQAEAVESQAKEWNPEEQTYSGRKPHKELIAEARHLRQQADELEKGV